MKEEKLVRTKYDLVMFIYAGIEIFVFGGITYGWPNLVRALKNENYFTEQCPTSPIVSLSNSTNTSGLVEQSLEEWSCSSQDDMFGLVYNIASVVTGIGNVAIGLAVDRLPMMVTRMIFMFLFLIGSVCISLSAPETGTLLIPGILMIRVGGFLMYYQNMRLANCAPRVKGTIITIYAGMFDSSSSLLYIIMVSYQAGFSVQLSFSIFAVALCIPLFMTLILFPMKSIDSDGKFKRFPEIAGCTINSNNFDDISTVDAEIIGTENTLKSQKSSEPTSEEKDLNIEDYECKKKGSCQEFLSKHNLTFILDKKFHFFLLVLSVLTLRKEFFVISYDAALVKSANGNKGLVEHYSAVFGIVQFFAILVTPIGGIIIDYSRSRGGHIIFA
ncbi:Solute carrier family 43 member 3 [Nymphon striatum]|nr:Solute carrier family 43 member 3 [Nymphon striatum]